MAFKTDYKDEIPEGGTALYNLVDQEGGVVQENIKIERSNENEQEGDLFGAFQLNEMCEALNNAQFMIKKGTNNVTYGSYKDWIEADKPVFEEENHLKTLLTKDYNPFPVGSIYMSVNNVNPEKYFGGTWVAWGSGRIPIGVKASDTDFATVEKTGGSKTHKLTVDEMPSHTHTFTGSSVTTASAGSHIHQVGTGAYASAPTASSGLPILGEPENLGKHKTTSAGSHTHTVTAKGSNSSTGGGQAFDMMNPYITCYMWKRTA